MPTGYTAPIEDGTDLNARNFVSHCARAFGAFVHQREEDIDSPPRPRDTSQIKYYTNKLEDAHLELSRLLALSDDEVRNLCSAHVQQIRKENLESLRRSNEINQRYSSVRAKVEAWDANEESMPIKKFCLDQIDDSTKYNGPYFKNAPLSSEQWLSDSIKYAKQNIEYYSHQLKEEKERHDKMVKYAKKVLESIKDVEE